MWKDLKLYILFLYNCSDFSFNYRVGRDIPLLHIQREKATTSWYKRKCQGAQKLKKNLELEHKENITMLYVKATYGHEE